MIIETTDNSYIFTPVKVNLQITIETKEELESLNRELNLIDRGIYDEDTNSLPICLNILDKISNKL